MQTGALWQSCHNRQSQAGDLKECKPTKGVSADKRYNNSSVKSYHCPLNKTCAKKNAKKKRHKSDEREACISFDKELQAERDEAVMGEKRQKKTKFKTWKKVLLLITDAVFIDIGDKKAFSHLLQHQSHEILIGVPD